MKLNNIFGTIIVTVVLTIPFRANAEKTRNESELKTKLLKDRQCIGCILDGVALTNNDLSKVDFSYASLKGAHLNKSILKGANLTGANLTKADLTEADLTEADLTNTTLDETNFKKTKLSKARFTNAHLAKSKNLSSAYLNGANFEGANLQGADLKSAYLNGANFEGANLQGVHLDSAYLDGANFEGANLQGVHLDSAYLNGANFEGANLQSADFEKADLSKSNLINVKLIGANLQNTNLRNTDLSGAKLSGVSLNNTNNQTNCSTQESTNQQKEKLERWANLHGANLHGANLHGAYIAGDELAFADLGEANLQGANLEYSCLKYGILVGANLTGADLQWVDLTKANLVGANLTGANLANAILEETDLTNVELDRTYLGSTHNNYFRNAFWMRIVAKIPGAGVLTDPSVNNFFDTFKYLLTPFTLVIAVLTFWRKQRSERKTYLNEKVKEFEEKIETINVRKMLNGELRRTDLLPSLNSPLSQFDSVTDQMLKDALNNNNISVELTKFSTVDSEKEKFEDNKVLCIAIRDNFNRFLDNFQQLSLMIQSHVVTISELEKYITPWIELFKKVGYSDKIYILKYLGLLNSVNEKYLSQTQKNVRKLFENYCRLDELFAPIEVESITQYLPINTEKCYWAFWFKSFHKYEKYEGFSNNIVSGYHDKIHQHKQLVDVRSRDYVDEQGYEKVFSNEENHFVIEAILRSNRFSLFLMQIWLRVLRTEKLYLKALLLFTDNFLFQLPFLAQPIFKRIQKINCSNYLLKIQGRPDIIAISNDPSKPTYVEICRPSDINKSEDIKLVKMYVFLLSQVHSSTPWLFSKRFNQKVKIPSVSNLKGRIYYDSVKCTVENEFKESYKELFSKINDRKIEPHPLKENCNRCDIPTSNCKKRHEGSITSLHE